MEDSFLAAVAYSIVESCDAAGEPIIGGVSPLSTTFAHDYISKSPHLCMSHAIHNQHPSRLCIPIRFTKFPSP